MSNKKNQKAARKKKSFWQVAMIAAIIAVVILFFCWAWTTKMLSDFGRFVHGIFKTGFILSIPAAIYCIFRFRIAASLLELEKQLSEAEISLAKETTVRHIKKAVAIKRAEVRLCGFDFRVFRDTKDLEMRWTLFAFTCAFVFAVLFILRIIVAVAAVRSTIAHVLLIIITIALVVMTVFGIYAFARAILKTRIAKMQAALKGRYTAKNLQDDIDEAAKATFKSRKSHNDTKAPRSRVPESDLKLSKKDRKKIRKQLLKEHKYDLRDGAPWTKEDVKETKKAISKLQKLDKGLGLGIRALR